ncbi:MAG: hypothetical protein U0325_05880 [Polyangiales bacterium]
MRGRLWGILSLLLGAAHCTNARVAGEQCVFNDDCVSPLVCAARRCRAPCRTGRDCPTGSVCVPSENPLVQVCVPERESSVCGGDGHCPPGGVCLDSACWWTCRSDDRCRALSADRCLQPPGLCALPMTARVQSEMLGVLSFVPPETSGPDAVTGGDRDAPEDGPTPRVAANDDVASAPTSR